MNTPPAADWLACFELGNQCYTLGDYSAALEHYLQALDLNQGSWEVRNNLAVLLKLLGERALAVQLLREALDLKPDYLDALNNLGNLYRDELRYDEARRCLDDALLLAPDNAEVLTNLGLLEKAQGRLAEALAIYRRAMASPERPAALTFNYAIALIQSGDWARGFGWYESRWALPRLAAQRQQIEAAVPAWRGEPLGGKTLLLWNEQGLGDTIQMVRLLPALRAGLPGCRLLLRVSPALLRLFACIDGVDGVVDASEPPPAADYHLSLMSLPLHFHLTPQTLPAWLPYLAADAALTKQWAARLGARDHRPRIGVVWQSGQAAVGADERDRQDRSLSETALRQLLSAMSADWIDLQYGADPLPVDLQAMMRSPGRIEDFADSAALLAQMDALVSVDTAAAHLGGAMGVPTIVLMSAQGGNLFPAEGETMPWYPSMRLLRQHAPRDWQSVLPALPAWIGGLAKKP
ncbi:tetratricopeptide repeat protein [Paludibacterium purpuratum]|uniref:TPR repeat protein n=1 Tax=Paludibacterium purpuratum TaxID=1144873 RepID=A0A4R7B3R8_9NEIS|nr:tetratricopeptide repeat protein [Paludibacterium purpuratum]TDR78468.1 TPR repeat protein [Paludibacterium purpuratum]